MPNYDKDKLAFIVSEYKRLFSYHRPYERYKWKAVNDYQESWDFQPTSPTDMLKKCLDSAGNLLRWQERDGLLKLSRKNPEAIHDCLVKLYANDGVHLTNKVSSFISGIKDLAASDLDDVVLHNQNERTASVYLFLLKPEEHYIYNIVGKFDKFVKHIDYTRDTGKPGVEKLLSYYRMCDEVLEFVKGDETLLKMNADDLALDSDIYYQDEYSRLLTDDILYYLYCYEWWPYENQYHPGIDKEKWKQLWANETIFNQNSRDAVSSFLDFENGATCTLVGRKYGKPSGFYNLTSTKLAERIIEVENCRVLIDNYENEELWPVLYVGKRANRKDEEGTYVWKLRQELREALTELGVSTPETVQTENAESKEPLIMEKNTILYGPPGTGKTYNTVRYAVAIIENKTFAEVKDEEYSAVRVRYLEHKKKGLIGFTTFHQSYGYEEFIEGIRPILATDHDSGSGDRIEYEIRPGVFKAFCSNAFHGTNISNDDLFDRSWDALVDASRANAECIYTFTRRTGTEINATLVNDTKFRVCWQSDQNSHNDLTKESIRHQWLSDINRDSLSGGSRWLFDARQSIIDEMTNNFNLKYSVENASKNHVFIIDEINRGNISKVFGELITLIEDQKRIGESEELSSVLPYSGVDFGVPNNVYIIGTMNTADRSIAMLDTALRRRFDFIEMQPEPRLLSGIVIDGIDIENLLSTMNRRVEVLYDREHTIGHSYFLHLKSNDPIDKLAEVFIKKIIPLLQEYFFDDYEKIRRVLGDSQKKESEICFITRNAVEPGLLGDDTSEYSETYTFRINSEAFLEKSAYNFLGYALGAGIEENEDIG